jgi:hypothetical protein
MRDRPGERLKYIEKGDSLPHSGPPRVGEAPLRHSTDFGGPALDKITHLAVGRHDLVTAVGSTAWTDLPFPPTYGEGQRDAFMVQFGETMLTVTIDIKPGCTPNAINLSSRGVIPAAILSSCEFDASQVDPATVSLAGSGVAVRGRGSRLMATLSRVTSGPDWVASAARGAKFCRRRNVSRYNAFPGWSFGPSESLPPAMPRLAAPLGAPKR